MTIFGLPAHPLIVHATVVLVPLAALALLGAALWPRFRTWAGPLPVILSIISLILVPITTSAGEDLKNALPPRDEVHKHAELGDLALLAVIPLAVLALALYAIPWLQKRGTLKLSESAARAMHRAVAGLSIIAAIGSIVLIVLIGHSGAAATWTGIGAG